MGDLTSQLSHEAHEALLGMGSLLSCSAGKHPVEKSAVDDAAVGTAAEDADHSSDEFCTASEMSIDQLTFSE
jgi:hypothetical protein